ncbi:MAG: hypothetical protein HOP29_02385 [Phycisphaerales bacterium]|nr:hypothetical protein [Phycisphaerales bacterium]
MENGGSDSFAKHPLPELFTPYQRKTLARRFRLTPLQSEFARLICLGHDNGRIAELLVMKRDTVRIHRKGLFERLNATDRADVPARLVAAHRAVRKPKQKPTE